MPCSPVTLPEPIAAYFNADKRDVEAIARCFRADALVKDEGRIHAGISAIRRWKTAALTKYTYTSEPLAIERRDGMTVVTSRLRDFPGSPTDLRFFFRLERGKLASLARDASRYTASMRWRRMAV
jgi:hypothetical protein